ncbi:uncharacterized protein B0J16DRAFT_414254 [Fusarium flagelliforme]|uniref:uncharacterized protein n=1 Tax=Fusarium flagelliforme TaxID=2675880 RepID=UPI001E8E9FE8|nr:uncharacterized protein B0J16DRAFT_414254 [Fusarium flagelliforme]KAH7184813.1 hypothetical protein B0J16DRAFT_414254 [Fusarium flagelliforme]
MDFIVVTNPSQRASAKTNRRVHAHAARVAHARTRRRHMAEYNQAETNIQQRDTNDPIRNKSGTITIPAESQSPLPPIPRTVAGDLQPDGISRFRQNLSPLEHFIFDHYIQTVLPAQISYCPIVMGLKEKVIDIRSHWMFFISSDPIILRGFLLAACRHLSLVELQDQYAPMAIKYKLSYLQGLQRCMFVDKPTSRREAVSMTTVLAFDEVICGNHALAAKHVLGAVNIIEHAGGIEALELNSVVRYILCSLLYGKGLVDRDRDLYLTTKSLTPDSIWP